MLVRLFSRVSRVAPSSTSPPSRRRETHEGEAVVDDPLPSDENEDEEIDVNAFCFPSPVESLSDGESTSNLNTCVSITLFLAMLLVVSSPAACCDVSAQVPDELVCGCRFSFGGESTSNVSSFVCGCRFSFARDGL